MKMNKLELAILLSIAIIILFAIPDMTYALRISVLGIIVTPVYLFFWFISWFTKRKREKKGNDIKTFYDDFF